MKKTALLLFLSISLATSCLADSCPRRIISLSPAITREIYDLGAQDRLVGVTSYRPEIAAGKTVVGDLKQQNIEQILALKPDLLIAARDCNVKSDIERLQQFGIRVEVFEGCENVECMNGEFIRLGELLGLGTEARAMVAALASDSQPATVGRHLRVFWQISADPLMTVSDATFSGEFIRRCGGTNIFGDSRINYPMVSLEEVIVRQPDLIIVVSAMQQDDEDLWHGLDCIPAVKNGRIYHLQADKVCQPTPRKFQEGLAAVRRIFMDASR